METYNCPLDESVTVIEIEADDDFHAKFGWACTILGETQPVIVVDCLIREEEWFTEDHLLAIFAHELGHIQLQSEDEFKADERGMEILWEATHWEAFDLLLARAQEAYPDMQFTH